MYFRDSTQAKLLLDGHIVGLNDTHRMYTRCFDDISFFVHGNADMLVAGQSMHKQASVSHVESFSTMIFAHKTLKILIFREIPGKNVFY